jgi:hypothetical protein
MLSAAVVGALFGFTLQNAAFNDGGTLSGSFEWNSSIDQVTTWDLAVSGGKIPAFEYTPSTSSGGGNHLSLELFRGGAGLSRIFLNFRHGVNEDPGLRLGANAFIEPVETDSIEQLYFTVGPNTFANARSFVAGPGFNVIPFATVYRDGVNLSIPEPEISLWLAALFGFLVVVRSIRRLTTSWTSATN